MDTDLEYPTASRFPECLRWSSDESVREDQLRELPTVLFAQLRHALPDSQTLPAQFHGGELGDAGAPSPASLFEAWNDRPSLPDGLVEVPESRIQEWLEAYWLAWQWREFPLDAEKRLWPHYVQGCANLLSGRTTSISIPVATVDGGMVGRVQMLHLAVERRSKEAALFMHPGFEFARTCFSEEFLSSLETAWRLAAQGCESPATVFWHITETDGRPIISEQQNGTSASAAAYRAFWHICRELFLDDEVYVLASCAAGNGRIEDVGGLNAKISAILQHRETTKQKVPATIVVAQDATMRSAHDEATIARAFTWAEVESVATTESLIAVRSVTVRAARDYLTHLAGRMDETPWFRNGAYVRFSDVHITPYVWKPKPGHSLPVDPTRDGNQSEERDWRPVGYDPSVADRETGPRLEKTRVQERIPWHDTFRHNEAITVIAGGPGSGKTSILQWTARMVALMGLDDIDKRLTQLDEINWPIHTDLDTWASLPDQPVETLEHAVIDRLDQIEKWGANRLEALRQFMKRRLIQSKANTFFFFDALDQVAEGKAVLLGKRLKDIASYSHPEWPNEPKSKRCTFRMAREIMTRGTKILISTRESGLRTHHQAMSFAPVSILQAAAFSAEDASALAAKWLGEAQASQLEAHLRTHPSLVVVADSPLLLTLACIVRSSQPQQSLPETSAELYQEMMRSLAQGEWRASSALEAGVGDPDHLIASLERIAWRLFARSPGVNRFERSVIVDAIEKATGSPLAQAKDLLATLVDLGFLESAGREAREEHFHFRHTTFLEFLVASHLVNGINRDGWAVSEVESWQPTAGWQKVRTKTLLDAQAFEPAWEPLIIFTAGLMKEPLPLIEVLADRKKDDLYRHRLGVLCRCCESIAAQKEAQLRDLLRSVLKQMAQIGRRAVRRRPERWKRWLENIGALLSLPQTSHEAVQLLVSLTGGRHEGKMHGDHKFLELLVAKASSSNFGAALDALLKLCTEDLEGHARDKMAIALVECAEKNGAHDYVEKLEALVTELGDKPWQQVAIYGGLLASRDSAVVDRATEFLKAKAQDWEAEEWVRSGAAHQLINLVGREQEMTVATILIDKIFKSYSAGAGDTASHSFAFEVVSAVLHRPSEFGIALSLLILRTHAHAGHLVFHCCEVLAKTRDPGLRQIGLKFLRDQLGHLGQVGSIGQPYAGDHICNTAAAKLLNELGGEEGRAESIDYLWAATALPVIRGWCHLNAVEALLEIGIPYDPGIHDLIERCCQSESMEHGVLAMMASIARSNDDNKILELVAPRLNQVIADAKSVHEPKKPGSFERDRSAKALVGTIHGKSLVISAFAMLYSGVRENSETDWFSVSTIAFGALSSEIVDLLPVLLREGKMDFRPWHRLLRELTKRGWRLRLRGRQIEVLLRGQEEPRADADFGY